MGHKCRYENHRHRRSSGVLVSIEAHEAVHFPINLPEGGGFTRLDKMFNGELQQVLETFNESIWQQTAV